MNLLLISVLVLVLFSDNAFGFLGFRMGKNGEPEFLPKNFWRHIKPLWITQKLDHFNPHENRTWKMRYMSNDEHFKKNGPIVIFIGGEWTITSGPLRGGQLYDIAAQHHGYMFYTEHRYYGQSQPTPNTATHNLRYLNADQALADLAYFVDYIKNNIAGLKESKVIVVGAAYAGNLAAWFRLKYPHICDMALASSAPVLAIADFSKYHEVLGSALKNEGGDTCYRIVEKGMDQLKKLLQRPGIGPLETAQLFYLCKPIDPKNSMEYFWFTSEIMDMFSTIVQNPQTKDIKKTCDLLQNVAYGPHGSELLALAEVFKSQSECKDIRYSEQLKTFKNTGFENSMRQWIYQTCTEFGYCQTDTSSMQPFGTGLFKVEHYIQFCKDVYEDNFVQNAEQIFYDGINRTNLIYGGLSPVNKVIYTYGTLDPWHAAGLLEQDSLESPVIVIDGASHLADLASVSLADSHSLKTAKRRVLNTIAKWLKDLDHT